MFSTMLTQFTPPVSLTGQNSAPSFILLCFTASLSRRTQGSRKDKHSAREPCTTETLHQSQQAPLELCCAWQPFPMCVHSAPASPNTEGRKKAHNHSYLPSPSRGQSKAAPLIPLSCMNESHEYSYSKKFLLKGCLSYIMLNKHKKYLTYLRCIHFFEVICEAVSWG